MFFNTKILEFAKQIGMTVSDADSGLPQSLNFGNITLILNE